VQLADADPRTAADYLKYVLAVIKIIRIALLSKISLI
jgi:hypothetical protein